MYFSRKETDVIRSVDPSTKNNLLLTQHKQRAFGESAVPLCLPPSPTTTPPTSTAALAVTLSGRFLLEDKFQKELVSNRVSSLTKCTHGHSSDHNGEGRQDGYFNGVVQQTKEPNEVTHTHLQAVPIAWRHQKITINLFIIPAFKQW